MRRSPAPSSGRELDFPPTSGVWSGWTGLALGAVGATVVATQGHSIVAVRFVIGFLLAMVLIYAFMLRPRVQVRDGAVRLVNPFHVTEIPLPLVRRVLVRSQTYVYVGDRKYAGVAVGRDPRDLTRSRDGSWQVSRGSETFRGHRRADGGMPPPVPLQVPDMLEEWVDIAVRDARRRPVTGDLSVRRTPFWALISLTAVLAAALGVALLVG